VALAADPGDAATSAAFVPGSWGGGCGLRHRKRGSGNISAYFCT